MRVVLRTWDILMLERVRSVLQARGILAHVSDEFTFAVPGLPGAENPRAVWVPEADWAAAIRALRNEIPPDELPALED